MELWHTIRTDERTLRQYNPAAYRASSGKEQADQAFPQHTQTRYPCPEIQLQHLLFDLLSDFLQFGSHNLLNPDLQSGVAALFHLIVHHGLQHLRNSYQADAGTGTGDRREIKFLVISMRGPE